MPILNGLRLFQFPRQDTFTIEKLCTLFRLPETIVSDNVSYFTSQEFEAFLKQNGIRHPTSSAYHPSLNDLAENAVKVVKHGFRKVKEGSVESRIAKVLFTYCTIPHSTTERAPVELLFGRIPRFTLDLLLPNAVSAAEEKQSQQKRAHDQKARDRTLVEGQTVFVRNFPMGDSCVPAQIVKQAGPLSFEVKLENGRMVKRHQDHIRSRLVNSSKNSSSDMMGQDSDSNLDFFPPSFGSHTENWSGQPSFTQCVT